MQSTGLGKVTVATAGTPILLSTLTTLTKVHRILVSFDASDSSSLWIYVKDKAGNKYASLSSATPAIIIGGDESNQVVVANYQIDSSSNGGGPIVGLDVV